MENTVSFQTQVWFANAGRSETVAKGPRVWLLPQRDAGGKLTSGPHSYGGAFVYAQSLGAASSPHSMNLVVSACEERVQSPQGWLLDVGQCFLRKPTSQTELSGEGCQACS